ncbi:NAD(P)H-dependent flavin oxidoreductase [Glaciibacter sp. 2TAF33]|uniref:NAD(P)H-dependent flavin oxidoreductase n=1 Tax=Glaciibacter sp. 2TAF33 TaxID=3233015 RepID=UPI003F91CFBD
MAGRTSDWRSTRLAGLLGLRLPIVLGPFGGISSVPLAAAVSNAGGLGSFGLYGYDAGRISETTTRLRAATDRPFNLNLWLDHDEATSLRPSEAEFAEWLRPLVPYFTELGVPLPTRPDRFLPTFDEQFEAVLSARPDVASFVFGVPSADVLERCRTAGIRTVGSATTVDEAVALDAAGVDAIVATGFEAGGHRVSFLREAEESLTGLFALLPHIVDAVSVPVIAAGGIADGRGIAAALTLGADAALIGTAFLATHESVAPAVHKAAIHGGEAGHTVLTRVFSGRLARGIPNRMQRELDQVSADLAPFPVQNWLTGRFKPIAAEQGNGELMSMWAGQSAPRARSIPAADLISALEAETDAALGRWR